MECRITPDRLATVNGKLKFLSEWVTLGDKAATMFWNDDTFSKSKFWKNWKHAASRGRFDVGAIHAGLAITTPGAGVVPKLFANAL